MMHDVRRHRFLRSRRSGGAELGAGIVSIHSLTSWVRQYRWSEGRLVGVGLAVDVVEGQEWTEGAQNRDSLYALHETGGGLLWLRT